MVLNTLAMVHDFLKKNISAGSFCIDATAGKGRDTLLLSQLSGPEGAVLSFDIQKEAVEATRKLLMENGLSAQVILDSHANMENYAKPGKVDAIVFNFGRLPGGNPNIMTRADTSLAAIDAGLRLLKVGGFIAIALYYGGLNGYGERDAILEHLTQIDDKRFSVLSCSWVNRRHDPPMPIFVWKERE